MGRVAGMHNAKIDARIEAGESSEEETDEDEEGEGGEEEVGEWEDVVKLAKGDTSEDERPRSPQEAFDEDQIRSLAEQLVAMEEDGRRAPLEVGGEYGTDGEETDEERTEEGRIVDFKLPGEPLPLVGLGGITFGWVPSEEDNFEGEEDGQDDVEMDDDEEDELATTSKYFNDDRSSTSPRKQPLQLDSPPPSSPRQTPGSPPPENDYDSAPNGEIDLSPRPINVDYSPAPDVVSPPPIPDRSSSPLEVFSPPPAAEASSPPLAAADHITFGDDDEYEEGSEDEPAVEEEGEGTRFRRTGDVLGFGEAPEEQDLVVSEDVVLGSSDEERGVESQDGRRGDSSEPLAYESTEDGEVEVRFFVSVLLPSEAELPSLRLLSTTENLLLLASRTSSLLELGILRRRFALEMPQRGKRRRLPRSRACSYVLLWASSRAVADVVGLLAELRIDGCRSRGRPAHHRRRPTRP